MQNQLTKHANNFAKLAANCSPDEQRVGLAFYAGWPLGHLAADPKTKDDILVLLGRWCLALGITNVPSSKEFTAISDFIIKHFGFLTYKELALAMEMAVLDEFECATKHYNAFSMQYVSRVLKEYQAYRGEQIRSIDRQSERLERERAAEQAKNGPKPAEQAATMRLIIQNEYAQFQKTGEVFDFFDVIWDYLKQSKKLRVSDEAKELAVKYAERKIKDMDEPQAQKHQPGRITDMMADDVTFRGIEGAKRKYSRMYCLREMFKTLDIEKFLEGITEQEFAPPAKTTAKNTTTTTTTKQIA